MESTSQSIIGRVHPPAMESRAPTLMRARRSEGATPVRARRSTRLLKGRFRRASSTRSTPSAESPFTNCSPTLSSRPSPVHRNSLAFTSGGSTVTPIRIASATYTNG